MNNLLTETKKILFAYGKTIEDIEWVGTEEFYMGWEDFVKKSNFNYDEGFGGNEINLNLLVVGKDFWLERHEYDGSEWWEFKTLPKKPNSKNIFLPLKNRE